MNTKPIRLALTIIAILTLTLALIGCKTPTNNTASSSSSSINYPVDSNGIIHYPDEIQREHAIVQRVIDGDTLLVKLDDGTENKVRLIGIDTPESVNPDESKNTKEGDIASDYVKSILPEGTEVWLESDMSDTDQYGRWLRYVWLYNPMTTDITFDLGTLNAQLVYYGYAHAKDYEPDTKYSATLHAQEEYMPPTDSLTPIGPLKSEKVVE